MSRTTLCLLTAGFLAAFSVGLMIVRLQVLGDEVRARSGPNAYKVTLRIRARSLGDAKLITAGPLDFQRQHISHEDWQSQELTYKPSEHNRAGDRRQFIWQQRQGVPKGPVEGRYEFFGRIDVRLPSAPMTELGKTLYAPPQAGEHLLAEPLIEVNHADINALALELTRQVTRPVDQARALFRFVEDELANEPSAGGPAVGALHCLQNGRGDAAGQSRLLTALCRNRGLPARLVTGLALDRPGEQKAHTWVEAWVGDRWMPLCPFHHHCGQVPPTYLIFGFGDIALVRGYNVRNLDYAFLVEHHTPPGRRVAEQPSWLKLAFRRVSLHALPPAERHLVEFLLLLPVAALIICVFRNVIGVQSFGTFAPALVGLAFRDLRGLPGILVFVAIILIGWGLRRVLDRYHLLQVPRSAFLLSLVVIVLLSSIVLANSYSLAVTRYFSLFPMVILTGMIERFWTLETEDGMASSFRTLVGTMLIAAVIAVILSLHALTRHLLRFPETLGLIMACQLLLGRYTGYRFSELLRFRDFLTPQPPRLRLHTQS